jgi:hypothetical protein
MSSARRRCTKADRSDGGGSSGSNGHHAGLTLGEAARIIREAVKDKSYRKTPLGQLVGRYLRWFRNEYGATESTIRDYEAILARMSLLADREAARGLDGGPPRGDRHLGDAARANPCQGHLRRSSLLDLGRGGRARPLLARLEDPPAARAAEDRTAPARARRRAPPRLRSELSSPSLAKGRRSG